MCDRKYRQDRKHLDVSSIERFGNTSGTTKGGFLHRETYSNRLQHRPPLATRLDTEEPSKVDSKANCRGIRLPIANAKGFISLDSS